jgi:hypothetical protein
MIVQVEIDNMLYEKYKSILIKKALKITKMNEILLTEAITELVKNNTINSIKK